MLAIGLEERGHKERRAAVRSPSVVPVRSPWGASYGRAGNTSVFSNCTDFKARGLSPRARRIVGATWAVVTGVLSTLDLNAGLETMSPTLVSPKLKPPCSAFFLVDPV